MYGNILILGDSWAVGHPHNFISDYGHDNGLSMDQLFQQKGYEVSNQSTYGCSNIETLTAGIQYMKYRAPQLPKIKLVIFFSTELPRHKNWLSTPWLWNEVDRHRYGGLEEAGRAKKENGQLYTLTEWLDMLHALQNKVLTDMRKLTPDAKWAVIGGQAPLHKPEEYQWADYVKEDWRSELVGYELPYSHTMSQQEDISKIFDLETKFKELAKYEIISEALRKSTNFFDNVHPSKHCYQTLTKELIEHFNL